MQVILLADVPKVGHKYEVKEVADGFARNNLIPRKLAEMATGAKLAAIKAKQAAWETQHEADVAALKDEFARIHGQSLHLPAKANEQGHLYQGLKADNIAACVNEKLGTHIDPAHVTRQEPIKDVGDHEISLSYEDLTATFTLVVKREE
ncbi:50S ribosomal protein L9 [Patescibacteria group bacterium]|jgi:large subunit ribosomal protein L9|nr:50S ribosomal protein L9 [Patescibacteria group bacterium]